MKKVFVIVILMITATSTFALSKDSSYREARKSGALAKIKLHIVDDLGNNVPGADVSVFFGMNFRPKGYYLKGVTDTNGVYVAEGKTCGDEIIVDVRKQGFYNSVKKLCFAKMGVEHKVEDGKWLPFNEIEKITLRKIEKPITLVALNKLIDVAYTNIWLGFDMEKMDFVKPNGNSSDIAFKTKDGTLIGFTTIQSDDITYDKMDFEIKVEWDGLPAWESKSCSAKIRFEGDGCGGYYAKNVSESSFPYTYQAEPNCSYAERMVCIVDRNGDPYTTKIPFVKDSSFVTRTRCQMDKGKIKVANYGCIIHLEIGPSRRGVALLRLSYVFNPTPNDTNLEPKR